MVSGCTHIARGKLSLCRVSDIQVVLLAVAEYKVSLVELGLGSLVSGSDDVP